MLFKLPLLCAAATAEEDRLNHETVLRTFKSLLTLEGRRRRGGFVPRASFQAHIASPWRCLCESGNNQVLIAKTGFNHKVLSNSNNLFAPVFC